MSGGRVIRKEAEKRELEKDMLMKCLLSMLRDEDNRYCADCDAKGPRWASWNIGVFLCIRCAGIHRKLGSHLSKVKSVNLDSWTPEQVQSMRVMGNSTARGVYEAGLPEHFRRPASDQSLEQFIRAKYETKRYVMKDWVRPPVDPRDLPIWDDLDQLWKHGTVKNRVAAPLAQPQSKAASSLGKLPTPAPVGRDRPRSPNTVGGDTLGKVESAAAKPSNDLLSLDLGGASQTSAMGAAVAPGPRGFAVDDLLGLGSAVQHQDTVPKVDSAPDFANFASHNNNDNQFTPFQSDNPPPAKCGPAKSHDSDDLFGAFVAADEPAAKPASGPGSKTTTADIMALYAKSQPQQQPFGQQHMPRMAAPAHNVPMGYPGGVMGGGNMRMPANVAAPPAAELPPQLVGFQSARPILQRAPGPVHMQPHAGLVNMQQHGGLMHMQQQPPQLQQQVQQLHQQPGAVQQRPVHDAFASLSIGAVGQQGWQQPTAVRPQQQQNELSLW